MSEITNISFINTFIPEFTRMFFDLSDIMLQDTEDAPLEKKSVDPTKVPIKDAISHLKERYVTKLRKLGAIHSLQKIYSPEEQTKLIKSFDDAVATATYPSFVAVNSDAERTQVAEASAEQITEAEMRVQQQVIVTTNASSHAHARQIVDVEAIDDAEAEQHATDPLRDRAHLPYDKNASPKPLKDFLQNDLVRFRALFSESLEAMPNVFLTFDGDRIDNPGFVNSYYKPLDYLWLTQDGAGKIEKAVICDLADGLNMQQSKKDGILWLINHGVAGGSKLVKTADLLASSSLRLLQMQAKVWNGDLMFNDEEQTLFAKWIDSVQKFKLLMDFLSLLQISRPHLPETAGYERLRSWAKEKKYLAE